MTSYHFSCFTRFNPCKEIEDLLPAAKPWHLYKEEELSGASDQQLCDVPVWALARDDRYIVNIEVFWTKTKKDEYGALEVANVRVVDSLKEPAPWLPGAVVKEVQRLIPGRRYLVFPIGDDARYQLVTKNSPLRFERCGVQKDASENRRELEQGFAQMTLCAPSPYLSRLRFPSAPTRIRKAA